METPQTSHDQGFSPDISADLFIRGERFKVGSLGPNEIMLQDPRKIAPGRGVIHFRLDGRLSVYHVELTDGIDPSRAIQPLLLLPAGEEAVA